MTPEVPPPLWCGEYAAGHDVHWIQALRAARHPRVPGRLLDVRPDGSARVLTATAVVLLWHHHPRRLAVVAGRNRNGVLLQLRSALLLVPDREGQLRCFSVLPGGEVGRSCSVARLATDPDPAGMPGTGP